MKEQKTLNDIDTILTQLQKNVISGEYNSVKKVNRLVLKYISEIKEFIAIGGNNE